MTSRVKLGFNEIYVLNLHGNLRKKETAPNGSVDKNVFDIQQGVAIGLFVKVTNKTGCRLFHADLWGEREQKYETLWEADAAKTQWKELKPKEPHFFFVTKNLKLSTEYQAGVILTDIFNINAAGIQTDRDELFFGDTYEEVAHRLQIFFSPAGIAEPFKSQYRVEDSSSYPIIKRRSYAHYDKGCICQCLYRPFDMRWLYYSAGITSRPAWEVMQHMHPKGSIGLLAMRQFEYDVPEYCYFLATRNLAERRIFISNRGAANCFPLYLADDNKSDNKLFGLTGACPNLSSAFLKALAEKLRLSQTEPFGLPKGITPEDIFNYAYAVFHSPTYRKRYAEFLKIDFPRLPLTSSLKQFRALAAKGAELVALHLLESPKVHDFITEFSEKGDNVVEKVQFVPSPALSPRKRGEGREQGCVFINKIQYFGDVPEAVWEFHIGGYQVCEKWLKDRKGRKLSYDDIQHYQKIVVALNETIRLMAEIDKLIPSWPIS